MFYSFITEIVRAKPTCLPVIAAFAKAKLQELNVDAHMIAVRPGV